MRTRLIELLRAWLGRPTVSELRMADELRMATDQNAELHQALMRSLKTERELRDLLRLHRDSAHVARDTISMTLRAYGDDGEPRMVAYQLHRTQLEQLRGDAGDVLADRARALYHALVKK